MSSQSPPADSPGRTERALRTLLWVEGGLLLVLLLASPFLFSLQADEAWNLLPIQTLVETGQYTHPAAPPARMSGGPYVWVQSLLLWLGGDTLPLLRAFPLLCLLLLLTGLYVWARRHLTSRTAALLAPCVLLATPGTMALGSAAFAVVPATLLLFYGVVAWAEQPGARAAVVAGALFGLAAATRANVGLVFGALLISVLLTRSARVDLGLAVRATAVGGLLFVSCFAGLALLGDTNTDVTVSRAVFVTGLGSDLGIRQWLPKLVMANGFMPVPLLVSASFAAHWIGQRDPALERATRLLSCFGWLAWLAWLWIAPLPHLRYLWPSLAAFSILLGLALASAYDWGARNASAPVRVAALSIAASCLALSTAVTYRNLALGDLNFLTWEWAEAAPLSTRADFRLAGKQRRMARYLRGLPADTEVASLDFALELEFLSGRRLPTLQELATREAWRTGERPTLLLTTTHLGRRGQLHPSAGPYLREHGALEARFGPYALWRVNGPFPTDLGILQFSVGPPQPYAGWPRRTPGDSE